MLKIDDYECKDCLHITEILVDSQKPLELQLKCNKCNSSNLVKVLSTGTGNKTHQSWSKWRTNVE